MAEQPARPTGTYHGVSSSTDSLGDHVRSVILDFLDQYRPQDSDPSQEPIYHTVFQEMKYSDTTTLVVDYSHLNEWQMGFATVVLENFVRIEPYLRQGVQNFVYKIDPQYCVYEDGEDKEFYISIVNPPYIERLRDLKTTKLGKLVAFSGTVTRTTEVRPELFLGAFKCGECGTCIKGVEQQFRYTTPIICTQHGCGNRTKWELLKDDSVFLDWQRIRVQENTDEVPAGSLPRTMDVVVRGQCVEVAKAGDKMVFTGALIVVPDVAAIRVPGERVSLKSGNRPSGNSGDGVTGIKATGMQELTYRTAFLATSLVEEDNRGGMVSIRSDEDLTPEEVLAAYDPPARDEVRAMATDRNILGRLASSIAPGVYGAYDIKQAVLLMLLGGVPKTTREGIKLRGDINVAIIGDPACAKSQILKYVASFLPRAIYTSGKASTAAGLTATVVKDADNGEFCIEAGALMLADNGICCIDEFDKMDVKDQVAIHEAMEQQTISIAKAGINATLNARASVLAAANPIGGRYDRTRTLRQNIALPPAILSRFDLLHVMLDEPNDALDQRIASHILSVHRRRDAAFAQVPFTTEQLQRYIRYARALNPMITPEAKQKMVEAYKELRTDDAAPGTMSSYRITVRQLEALVRLSEAVARAHCDPLIRPAYVAEAKRLLRASVLRVEVGELDLEDDPLVPPQGANQADLDAADAEARAAAGADTEMADADGGDENDAGAANRAPGSAGPKESAGLRAARESLAAAGPSGSGDAAGVSGQQQQQQQQQAGEAQPGARKTRVDAKKYNFVKNLLVRRLREQELRVLAAAGAADQEVESGPQESMGMKQAELVQWYLTHEIQRGVLAGEEALEEEFRLVERIINHLLKREGVLVVIHRPEQRQGEATADFLGRSMEERVLGLHPNFDPDA